jgi:ABC-type branched-subunit amino acid transport system substrate-binding protein
MLRSGSIFGILGPVGTPTSMMTEKVARGGAVPFIGPVTGAAFLRDAGLSHVVNIRASYQNEVDALVGHIVRRMGLKRFGLMFQGDAFGQTIRTALETALKGTGASVIREASYQRADGDIRGAAAALADCGAEAIMMGGTAAPSAAFVRAMRAAGYKGVFAGISFNGGAEFASAVGPAGEGVLVSQVAPPATAATGAAAAEFLAAMGGGPADPAAFEGYIIGRFVAAMLQRCDATPTRESFIAALRAEDDEILIGDHALRIGPRVTQASDTVFLTRLTAGGVHQAVGLR